MTLKIYKAALGVRNDMLYCPLSFSVDSYWNCEANCYHCYLRRLNRTWGNEQRIADPEIIRKQLINGLKNLNPKTSLGWAMKLKKTIRVGNKTDPFQKDELKYQISRKILEVLNTLNWSYVIQTRFLDNLDLNYFQIQEGTKKNLLTIMPIISPGAELDWEIFERKRTTPIKLRMEIIKDWIRMGVKVGVNGEPFIPGYHTEKQFEDICRRLKSIGVKSYNTYNLHMNDLVAKNLYKLGLDLEKIWTMNQDKNWRPILCRLCEIADRVGIVLGCPDFVNSPAQFRTNSNTCCGVSVSNPSRFNTHNWKNMLIDGHSPDRILKSTWEGIGDYEMGEKILKGKKSKFYTMKDARLI